MNKLLQRQIKKLFTGVDSVPKEFESFLKIIEETYDTFEDNLKLMENAFDVSSQEFAKINEQLEIEIKERKRTEEALRESERHLRLKLDYLLSPGKDIRDFSLDSLIDINTLQEIQDTFANTTGLASLICDLEGKPITKPSNFCKLCDIIRKTETGLCECMLADKLIGEKSKKLMKPIYTKCGVCGIIQACAPIIVGDIHIATWLIGQVNIGGIDKKRVIDYCTRIGADVDYALESVDEIRQFDEGKFESILSLLWSFAKNLSLLGFNNLKLAKELVERERLESEIIKTRKLESIGILAGGIAHDFNNILTSIIGNISLAKYYLSEENALYKIITNAEIASERAKDLTHQLLTFSKGGAPIKKTTSITDLIKDSARFVLKGSNVKCEFIMPDDVSPVEVDIGQMNQVINNLIINANQAMPNGGIITVSCENINIEEKNKFSLKPGNYVKISVADKGIGIPEQIISKIFDPYFTTKEKGSGLGLATTYSIIKKHDGHINVESQVGIGTTFHIYLPVSSKKIDKTDKTDVLIKGTGKILIMDDNTMLRNTVADMLESLGYTPICTSNGSEAIDVYKEMLEQENPFDLVIMDLIIPGALGGKEATQKIIQIHKDAKIIVSSGYSNDPIMANFKDYGFCGVLKKPVNIEELSTTIASILQNNVSGK